MASTNRIIKWKALATITKGGTPLALGAASKSLPVGTAKVVMRYTVYCQLKLVPSLICHREAEHSSASDQKDHYTAVCLDENDKYLGTEHFDK